MRLSYVLLGLLFLVSAPTLWAQDDDDDEEDFSMYDDLSLIDTTPVKRYCTSKITAQTPNRLVAVGYDFFGPHSLSTAYSEDASAAQLPADMRFSHGLRAEANFPVVSTNKILFSLGGAYVEQRYALKPQDAATVASSPMYQSLDAGSIRNLSLIATLFKPLNEKTFLLFQGQGDYAGDWSLTEWHSPRYIKWSGAAIYGFKPEKYNNRLMWGLGITRTFRAGEINYLPLFYFNYTNPSEKWGAEMLLPARADLRYNISKRNILRFGLELEGSSYRLSDRNGAIRNTLMAADSARYASNPFDRLELRRSDIRIRAMWDFPVKDFYWLSLSVGYRMVYRYNVDQENREMYRGFGIVSDDPYLLYNNMGGAVFVSIVATLVSP